jgi:hypothetical protein
MGFLFLLPGERELHIDLDLLNGGKIEDHILRYPDLRQDCIKNLPETRVILCRERKPE